MPKLRQYKTFTGNENVKSPLGDCIIMYSKIGDADYRARMGKFYAGEWDHKDVLDMMGISYLEWNGERCHKFYTDFTGNKVKKFNPSLYKKVKLPKEPFWTYQFDSMNASNDIAKGVKFLTKKQQDKVHKKYKGEKIDLGGKAYTLPETAYILSKAEGHYGACSGIGWMAVAADVKNIDIYWGINPFKNKLDQADKDLWTTWKKHWNNEGINPIAL